MFDMRYHIASLIAVFFALAIGIILGTVIVDKGVLVDQQQALVKRIEKNFDNLRVENRLLNEQVVKQEEFKNQAIPLMTRGRLEGNSVAVLITTQVENEVVSDLANAIEKAGAKTVSIRVRDDFNMTEQVIDQVKPYFSTDINSDNARELMLKRMVDELSMTVNTTSTSTQISSTTLVNTEPYLSQLNGIGLVETSIDFNAQRENITAAVILGGTNTESEASVTDLPIILRFKDLGLRIVGVETSECKKSYMRAYQAAGISTVDNVDQAEGIVSTIFALAGADGHFGIKKTAVRQMPSF